MGEPHSACIEIVSAVREQEPLLVKLLELYAKDFREFHAVEVGPHGRFVYEKLPLYWSEAGRHPFFVMADGAVAGFVFVKRGSEVSGDPCVWDMAEFFIMREMRRRGVGTGVAQKIWRQFPGHWEVRVMEANQLASRFWSQAIATFAGGTVMADRVEKGGMVWHVFSFESQ